MRRLLVSVALVATASTALALPAVSARAAERHWTGPTQSLSLQLAPRDAAGLAALAQSSATTAPAARFARLAQVNPGAARSAQVVSVLKGLGFTVADASEYTVHATGPASLIAAYFGSARAVAPTLKTGQPLPVLPAGLRGLVTAAYGGDETRPAYVSHTKIRRVTPHVVDDSPLTATQARALYGVTATSAQVTSSSPIVATLQFATDPTLSSDLSSFASANGLPATNANTYTTNKIDQTSSSCNSGVVGTDDAVEVALDQEALQLIAPQLRQRIYEAPNCGNTQNDALLALATDAKTMPILAVSTSWGSCEPVAYGNGQNPSGGTAAANADQQAVNTALAAGVTVFAASGDDGTNDCIDGNGNEIQADAVDSPAVVPNVIGVGGTIGTAVNNMTAWSDGLGASGGGFSCGLFARPAYQARVALVPSYPAPNGYGCRATGNGTARQVPDISANAGNGINVYCAYDSPDGSNVNCDTFDPSSSTNPKVVIGTSFAAPLAAGGFAQSAFNAGFTKGLGNVAAGLYTGGGIIDVQSGNNGAYNAGAGYDLVTGLGTPVWPSLIRTLRDAQTINVDSAGNVSVTLALASTGYTSATTYATALKLTSAQQQSWQLMFAPYNGDARADLWAIGLNDTGSGKVEVHVLTQVSNYRTFATHAATSLGVVRASDWQARVASYAGDRQQDLFLIDRVNTGSGMVEVHTLSQASNYQTFLVHAATALAADPTGTFTYLVGDAARSGDLVAVKPQGASGYLEVHVLSRTSGYRTFTLHRATPQPSPTGSQAYRYGLFDVNVDGQPDVAIIVTANSGSGKVEVHSLGGPSYSAFVAHQITTIPQSSTAVGYVANGF